MKKMITLPLVFALALTVISAAASAEGGKWPVRELNGTPVELRTTVFKNAREQSFAGPTRQYALSGAFLSRRVNKATALLREGNAVLEEMVRRLMESGETLYQVNIELLPSPDDPGLYDWSFGQPEDVNMNVGTYCSVLSETRRRSMFQYLFEEARTRFRAVKLRME